MVSMCTYKDSQRDIVSREFSPYRWAASQNDVGDEEGYIRQNVEPHVASNPQFNRGTAKTQI